MNKAVGKQKDRVFDIIELYKKGKIFNQTTVTNELNRYLGHFENEDKRDSYYFKTMAKYIVKKDRTSQTENKRLQKQFDKSLEKVEHIKRYRETSKFIKQTEIKDDPDVTSKNKAFKTFNMDLNTKMIFSKSVMDKIKRGFHSEGLKPNNDVIFDYISPKIKDVFRYRLQEILKTHDSFKVSLGIKFTVFTLEKVLETTVYRENELIAKTKATSINKANVESKISDIILELDAKISEMLGKLQGSNWRIKQYHTLFIEVYKTKNARGSSYIPLPENILTLNTVL